MNTPAPTSRSYVQFQCPHCAALLRIPSEQSGCVGPCPICYHQIASPAVSSSPVAEVAHKGQRTKLMGSVVAGGKSVSGRSFSRPEKKTLNPRGILADQAVHHLEERKKEARREIRMYVWCALVFLVLAASTYLMKSLVAGR